MMKALLLILALFAFAAHADVPINTTDYCLGFANGTNFTFTNVEIQNCIKCLEARFPIDYQQLDEYKPFNTSTVRDGLYHAIYQKDRVRRNCKPFVSDLQAFFSANKTADELFNIIDVNSKTFPTALKVQANLLKSKAALAYLFGYDFGYYKAITLRYATGVLVPDATSEPSALTHHRDGFLAF